MDEKPLPPQNNFIKYISISLICVNILIKASVLLMMAISKPHGIWWWLIFILILANSLLVPDIILLITNIKANKKIDTQYILLINWAVLTTVGLLTLYFWMGFITLLIILVVLVYVIFYTQPVWRNFLRPKPNNLPPA